MLKTIKFLTAALFFTTVISCNSGDSDKGTAMSNSDTTMATNNDTKSANTTTIFKATLKGSDEVPSNSSTATGTSTLTYNGDTKTFTDVTSYTGITPTMGHIHKAAAGANGPVVFPFTELASPINLTSEALTDEQVTALFADSMYVNLHTKEFPGGEIRGQLIKQ
ncbi:MAG: CHRD domain-containing protein [Ginsengibacter sp.]